jgi:hypothetical protein
MQDTHYSKVIRTTPLTLWLLSIHRFYPLASLLKRSQRCHSTSLQGSIISILTWQSIFSLSKGDENTTTHWTKHLFHSKCGEMILLEGLVILCYFLSRRELIPRERKGRSIQASRQRIWCTTLISSIICHVIYKGCIVVFKTRKWICPFLF